jgi:methyl-accepting chemotaxis protein
VQVVPILAQDATAVRRYVEETGVPFNILIDESRDVARAYGVWHRVGLDAWNIARPAVFLIDRSGAIRWSFVGRGQRESPSAEEILRAADTLRLDR